MKRTLLISAFAALILPLSSFADTEVVDGITWTYMVSDGETRIGGDFLETTAVPIATTGNISIPAMLGGCPVTSIGDTAFYGCSNLVSITIPDGVTSIGGYAFKGCSGLTSITIPDGVTSIGFDAFSGCSGLTEITIPANVSDIGTRAFGNCSGLMSIVVDAANPVFDSRNGCNAIIETASNCIIAGCKNTVIPNDVRGIGDYAFNRCNGLSSIMIPRNVTNISDSAFSACSGLVSIVVDSSNPVYDSRGNCNAIIETANNKLVVGCRQTVIPDNVTTIGFWSFTCRSGMTSITIPIGVTTIEAGAFGDCSDLLSIVIPASVRTIESRAFSGCSKLKSVVIPDSVTNIGDRMFEGCVGLASIRVPYEFFIVASDWWCLPEGCRIQAGSPMPLAFVTDETLPVARTGFWYSQPLEATGGLRPYSFELLTDDERPSWLQVDNGLSGRPYEADAGTNSFAIRVTDATGTNIVVRSFTIVVETNSPPVFESEMNIFSIDIGESTNLVVSANDPDGDELSFYWEIYVQTDDGWSWHSGCYASESFAFNSDAYQIGQYVIQVTVSDGAVSICLPYGIVTVVEKESFVVVEGVEIPVAWLDEEAATAVAAADGDYETAAKSMSANGENKIWECYVAGLSPTNAAERFEARIGFENGGLVVTWTPDLGDARDYVVLGKTNLVDESWGPTNESTRFFRVKVSMP